MTTGIQGIVGDALVVRLLEDLAAANGVPPDGAPGDVLKARPTSTTFFDFDELRKYWRETFNAEWTWPDHSWIELFETAGDGVITVAYIRAWSYSKQAKKAFPPGPGTDANKGKLNDAQALGETAADQLRHKELLAYPVHGDGIQFELGTIANGGGITPPKFTLDWHIPIPLPRPRVG